MSKIYLFVALILSACGTSQQPTTPTTKDGDFKKGVSFQTVSLSLLELKEAGDKFSNTEYSIQLNIDLEKGTYNGKSGCNNYFGSIDRNDADRLMFGMAGVTEMMCMEDVMQWEARYLNALTEKVFDVYESDDQIQLKDSENNVVLTFSKTQP